jgi:ATP-binding cassette subfamily F protein 3
MILLDNVQKRFGPKILFENVTMQFDPGKRYGLTGANGAGKSTLLKMLGGDEETDQGSITIPGNMRLGVLRQNHFEYDKERIIDAVLMGNKRLWSAMQEKEHLYTQEITDEVGMRLGELEGIVGEEDGYTADSRAAELLIGLGIPERKHNDTMSSLSGGYKLRVLLAQVLFGAPDVLLLDEPTNHLDLESILWLEEWFQNFKGAIVMTSHDREFMNRIVKRIVEVANKTITTYSGNYDFYLKEREIRKEQLLASHQKQQDMLAKEQEFIARFAARASHAAQVQSRVKKLDKIERIEIPAEDRVMNFDFGTPPRSGNDVVRFTGLGKTYPREDGGEKKVFSGLTGYIQRLDKIAIVGVNGAGKSTLLKIMAGQTNPTDGTCVIGANVKIGYFSQSSLDVLNPNKTIFQEIYDRIPEATIGFVRNLLGAFLFSGDDAEKKIGILSGGEKSRVVLATILATPVNFLILDEPTNHLDIKSREVLLDAIKNFDGTVALVSHDRHFLREVAGRVFEVDHGTLRAYEGDFEYYIDSSPLAKSTNGRLKVAR